MRDTRILIPNRSWHRVVSAGAILDFEDAMAGVASTEFLELPPLGRRAKLRALRAGKVIRAVSIQNGPYDVCLLIIFHPDEIRSLAYIKGLRRSCRRIAVYIFDSWVGATDVFRRHRELWRLCDQIFVSFPRAVQVYAKHVPCPVEYLPQAINPTRFHPFREDRPIHLLSVGRRLDGVHRKLLEIARRHDLWYHFAEFRMPIPLDLSESQYLLARLCQSARVQICWPIDVTHAELARPGFSAEDGSPVTVRWFEAAACGSVVLGTRPRSEEFERLFPFPGFIREIDPSSVSTIERAVLDALETDDVVERRALADHVRRFHTWQARAKRILEALEPGA